MDFGPRKRVRAAVRTASTVSMLGAFLVGCIDGQEAIPIDAIRVGALLPFSGDLAASGSNLERPLLMAAESINERGGLGGRVVAVLAVDSNRYFPPDGLISDHQEALRAFLRGDDTHPRVAEDDRIIPGSGIDVLLGPLIPDLSLRLATEARRNNIVHMTANVAPESTLSGRCSFSLYPSFRVLGRALGQKMRADGIESAGIIYLDDDYNEKLQTQVDVAFSTAGGTLVGKSPTTTGKDSYVEDINNALSGDPQALVLLAPPRLASRIVTQTLAAERSRTRVGANTNNPIRWYFSPLLRVSDFAKNVPPGLVNGGVGVAPGVNQAPSSAFRTRFRDRWDAEPTLDGQYLFDAMNVLLLTLDATLRTYPGQNLTTDASYAASCENVRSVTKDGLPVTWQDVDGGGAFGQAGASDVDYQGLTGPVEFDDLGNAQEGLVEIWQFDPAGSDAIQTISVDSVQTILSR